MKAYFNFFATACLASVALPTQAKEWFYQQPQLAFSKKTAHSTPITKLDVNKPIRHYLGLNTGIARLNGEMVPKNGMAFTLHYQYKLGRVISLGAEFSLSKPKGTKDAEIFLNYPLSYSHRSSYGNFYHGKVTRLDLQTTASIRSFQFNVFVDLTPNWMKDYQFYLNAYTGIGVLQANSKLTYIDNRDSILEYSGPSSNYEVKANPAKGQQAWEQYQGTHLFLPVGITLHKQLTYRWGVEMHYSKRFTRTDDLDVFHKPYNEPFAFDNWTQLQVGLSYRF